MHVLAVLIVRFQNENINIDKRSNLMAYKRTLKIRVDAPENILNSQSTAIFDEWVAAGKILQNGVEEDPDDSDNIITYLTFNNESECEEYFDLLTANMTEGVDDTNFTIIETTNEHI